MVQSVRLTNALRDSIASKVIKYKYENNSKAAEFVKEAASIAQAVYNSVLDEPTREKINALPSGWVPEVDQISVSFGYGYTYLNFNGSINNFLKHRYRENHSTRIHNVIPTLCGGDEVNKRVPSDKTRCGAFATFRHSHELTSRFDKLKSSVEDFQEEYNKDVASIRSTLASFTTAKKLMDDWKEITPFVKALIGNSDKPVVTALAIPVADLNARFGLPVPA